MHWGFIHMVAEAASHTAQPPTYGFAIVVTLMTLAMMTALDNHLKPSATTSFAVVCSRTARAGQTVPPVVLQRLVTVPQLVHQALRRLLSTRHETSAGNQPLIAFRLRRGSAP